MTKEYAIAYAPEALDDLRGIVEHVAIKLGYPHAAKRQAE